MNPGDKITGKISKKMTVKILSVPKTGTQPTGAHQTGTGNGVVNVSEPAALDPGAMINRRYRIERLLGHGGMGTVYLARDTLKGGRLVALKMLRAADFSAEQLLMLHNEFETMVGLSHPNLASLYDFEILQGTDTHFVTMEFVSGASMDVAAAGATWQQVLDLVVQVCRALTYMHSRAVIHFDLKPANIMVSGDSKVKVLDFGLAGTRAYRARKGKLLASPAYMAPELALSPTTADHRADLYSLGIVLYQFLTGGLPFCGTSASEMLRAHCYTPVEFDPASEQALPPWIRRLVLRLCEKDPAHRFLTANAVIEEINREGGLTYEVETRQTRESYLLSSRFVARENEFQVIMGHVIEQNVAKGTKQKPALFVSGVSGIGKSRILREVRHHLQMSRLSFVEASCHEEAHSEFAPIVEAVRHVVMLVESRGGGGISTGYGPELAKLDAQLAREKRWTASAASENPGEERQRIIQHVAEFLLDAAREIGFTLCVNDLQWAQQGTVDVLACLLRLLSSRRQAGEVVRFCLLGSYREDELEGRPAARLLEELRNARLCREVELGLLTQENVGQLLGSMLGISSLSETFVSKVCEESGGNPYFVEEILRALVEDGAVYLEDGKWAAGEDVTHIKLPRSVTDALLKRFALLDAPHRHVLELMALHARPLPVKVLQAMVKEDAAVLQKMLNVLTQRRMVVLLQEGETAYQVAHNRLRESVCDAIPEPRRRELHGLIADGLAALYKRNPEEAIYDLARHAWEAQDLTRALDYSLRAGEKAVREYANDLGIVLYQRALELLAKGEKEALRLDVIEKLGGMYFLTGAYDDAMRRFDEALAAAEDSLTQARLRRKQALVHHARGELDQARDRLWQAAELLGGRTRPRNRFEYAAALAVHRAIHLLHRVLPFTVGRVRGDARRARLAELSEVCLRLGEVYFFTDPIHMTLPLLIGVHTGERLGDSLQLCHACSLLGMVSAACGSFRGARRYGEKGLALGKRLGQSLHLGQAYAYRGMGLFYMGKLDEALAALEQGRRLLSQAGDLFDLESCCAHISYIHACQGKHAMSLADANEGLGLLQKAHVPQLGKTLTMHAALAGARLGKPEGAREHMEEATRLCGEANDVSGQAVFRILHAELLLMNGEADEAVKRLNEARRLVKRRALRHDHAMGLYAALVRAHWEKHLQDLRAPGERMTSGGRRRLRRLSRKALRVARSGHPNHLSAGLISRGLSLWLDGQEESARRSFKKGLDAARQRGADRWLAEGCFEVGRCLMLSPKTKAEGLRYLKQAEKLFGEQGCRPYQERAGEWLAKEAKT